MKGETLHMLSREVLSAQSLARRSPLMTSLAPRLPPPAAVVSACFRRAVVLKWGPEYVDVEEAVSQTIK